ncbi:MAG: DUF4893 domain-containing protein [Caulobacter sp.]|nr:DUF4893 domain-containing protein [Caulobacter sp.]
MDRTSVSGLDGTAGPGDGWGMINRALPLLAALALAACSPPPAKPAEPAKPAAPAVPAEPATPAVPATPAAGEQGGAALWRTVATAEDQDRVDRLDAAWRAALAEASHEHGAVLDSLSLLGVPGGALAGNLQPAPGKYRCRTIKIGAKGEGNLTYVAYGWFTCTIELTPGGDLILTKTGGSQRTRGLLYPDTDRRLVFVGAQAWGTDETEYPAYGQRVERDQVGVFERVGVSRWRLVLPWPKQESKLEILELKR